MLEPRTLIIDIEESLGQFSGLFKARNSLQHNNVMPCLLQLLCYSLQDPLNRRLDILRC